MTESLSQLSITWRVNTAEHIVEKLNIPEDLIRCPAITLLEMMLMMMVIMMMMAIKTRIPQHETENMKELQKLSITSYLESQVKMSVLSCPVLSCPP